MKLEVKEIGNSVKRGDHYRSEGRLWVVVSWINGGVVYWALADIGNGEFWAGPTKDRSGIFAEREHQFTKVEIVLTS